MIYIFLEEDNLQQTPWVKFIHPSGSNNDLTGALAFGAQGKCDKDGEGYLEISMHAGDLHTNSKLVTVLKEHGVRKIDVKNEKFYIKSKALAGSLGGHQLRSSDLNARITLRGTDQDHYAVTTSIERIPEKAEGDVLDCFLKLWKNLMEGSCFMHTSYQWGKAE